MIKKMLCIFSIIIITLALTSSSIVLADDDGTQDDIMDSLTEKLQESNKNLSDYLSEKNGNEDEDEDEVTTSGGDFWQQANEWFKAGKDKNQNNQNYQIDESASKIISEFGNMVNVLGTTVIVLVTIFLGIKYMFGTFEAKADVKESLVTLLVACVFFFGWDAIWNLLFPNGDFVFNPSTATSYTTPLGIVFSTATKIANFAAIGAVIYIGIKYIFAGASGKADLKAHSGQFIIGAIMAFCAIGLLNYISTIVNQILS